MILLPASTPAPAYVGVSLDDRRTPWRLTPTRTAVRVPHGRRTRLIVFSVQNYGMDPHNLAVERVGSSQPIRRPLPVAAASAGRPGSGTVRIALPPGTYRILCSIAQGTSGSHARAGMLSRFVVAPPR